MAHTATPISTTRTSSDVSEPLPAGDLIFNFNAIAAPLKTASMFLYLYAF
jgi:hypothetical protein